MKLFGYDKVLVWVLATFLILESFKRGGKLKEEIETTTKVVQPQVVWYCNKNAMDNSKGWKELCVGKGTGTKVVDIVLKIKIT